MFTVPSTGEFVWASQNNETSVPDKPSPVAGRPCYTCVVRNVVVRVSPV